MGNQTIKMADVCHDEIKSSNYYLLNMSAEYFVQSPSRSVKCSTTCHKVCSFSESF